MPSGSRTYNIAIHDKSHQDTILYTIKSKKEIKNNLKTKRTQTENIGA